VLPTESLWIGWFLEIRLYFHWLFIGASTGGLFLANAFGGGLFLLARGVLPKLSEAILKVVLVINIPLILTIF
jgi:anaerobic C4-dicarboxylate transporter